LFCEGGADFGLGSQDDIPDDTLGLLEIQLSVQLSTCHFIIWSLYPYFKFSYVLQRLSVF